MSRHGCELQHKAGLIICDKCDMHLENHVSYRCKKCKKDYCDPTTSQTNFKKKM
eukprot:gene2959-285_t